MNFSPRARLLGALRTIALLCAAAFVAAPVAAQTWEYRPWSRTPNSGPSDSDPSEMSTISIKKRGGAWTFRMNVPGKGNPCFTEDDMPAEVQKSRDATTITVTPSTAECQPFRYVIQNDGSGGVKQNKRGDKWVDDGFDHGLTPVK